MPSSDYGFVGGGALKLKGSKPAGVEKKRKKKKPSATASSGEKSTRQEPSVKDAKAQDRGEDDDHGRDMEREGVAETGEGSDTDAQHVVKTRAEREQEERRRKKVRPRIRSIKQGCS